MPLIVAFLLSACAFIFDLSPAGDGRMESLQHTYLSSRINHGFPMRFSTNKLSDKRKDVDYRRKQAIFRRAMYRKRKTKGVASRLKKDVAKLRVYNYFSIRSNNKEDHITVITNTIWL